MSLTYGVKIRNFQGASIFEHNIGVRNHYDYTNAMFTNSLFNDFLQKNGMKIYKESSTRDIIGINFDFGARSYEDEIKHLEKHIKLTENKIKQKDKDDNAKKLESKLEYLKKLRQEADENKNKFCKKSREELRQMFYENGINITYTTYKTDGTVKKEETLHYKMLYRSTGKAKKGSCMFIVDRLYKKSINFLRMGIKLPSENAPLVEISAYAPLVASTIVGRIKINPKNILILKDVKSLFNRDVISVETDEQRHCISRYIADYQLSNEMFDGQALLDSSIFPNWADGFVLLRQHFCKMASFNTNIQQFYKDYFGDAYLTAQVTDMFGNQHYAKDIELITTNNSMKWLKFGVSYDYWCDRVMENDCMFGIVKTTHPSKLGDVQRMSYQMVNALDMDSMESVTQRTVDYINQLKNDDDVFLDYLDKNKNFSNDYECLLALVNQNREFLRSQYFRDRKTYIISNYINNFKRGRVVQNADNLTLVGSPYAELLWSVGDDPLSDPTFENENGCIQCYSERFDDGEYLAEMRNPFNGMDNLGYLHNHLHPLIKKYFTFGRLVIAVNCNHTDFEDRNNGSDFDSDTIYVTNQKDIVQRAKYCYVHYPTIINNIPQSKKHYDNTLKSFADIDNALAKAQTAIGESSNIAQIALTYTYNFDDVKYRDYMCILSVLAQVAIDNAKRVYDIDLIDEIHKIKKDMKIDDNGYPKFWLMIHGDFDRKKINFNLKCPMNSLYDIKFRRYKSKLSTLQMDSFFVKYKLDENRRKCAKVEDIIEQYSLMLYYDYQSEQEEDDLNEKENDWVLCESDFNDMITEIKQVYVSSSYLGLYSWLLDRAFCITPQANRNANRSGEGYMNYKTQQMTDNNKALLMSVLYKINPQNLLKCFAKNV